jgi:hypothetical protein
LINPWKVADIEMLPSTVWWDGMVVAGKIPLPKDISFAGADHRNMGRFEEEEEERD